MRLPEPSEATSEGPRRIPGDGHRPGVRGGAPRKKKGGFFKSYNYLSRKFAAGFISPAHGAAYQSRYRRGQKALKKPGVAGYDGFGALYPAPDGSLYQVQGLADEELRGFAEDEELEALPKMKNCEAWTRTGENCGAWMRTRSYRALTRMKISVDLLKTRPCRASMAMCGRMV